MSYQRLSKFIQKGADDRSMDYHETLYKWEGYSEVLYPLQAEVLRTFADKSYYDDRMQYQEQYYESDEDTVFLIKLSDKLTDICNFIQSHIGILEHRVHIEEELQLNLEQSFEAWKRNLCPILMSNVQRTLKPPDYNIWGTYDEVADYLVEQVMSYNGTKQAISSWQESQELYLKPAI